MLNSSEYGQHAEQPLWHVIYSLLHITMPTVRCWSGVCTFTETRIAMAQYQCPSV